MSLPTLRSRTTLSARKSECGIGRCREFTVVACLAALALPQTLLAQGDIGRDEWQRPTEVLTALQVREGSVVADVGAGRGYLTAKLAESVGATGKVFAVDIDDIVLRRLRNRVESDDLTAVEVVKGSVDDPGLPPDALDAVLIVDAYHEMTEHDAMLAALLRSLKPGARLVMLEFQPSDPNAPRPSHTAAHTIALATVETELIEAGFEIISRNDSFTNASGTRGRRGVQWMLVARRPDDTRHRQASDTRSPQRHPWPR